MIAIIGAGNVGKALAAGLRRAGAEFVFGVPEPEKHQALASEMGSRALTVEDAIGVAEIVVLAVPHAAAESVAVSMPDWGGRILVDATNPIAPKLAGLTIGTTTSAAEELANAAKGARVVKAFNTTGAENMANPAYGDHRVFLPVCGDDPAARAAVVDLARRMGFDAEDIGPLSAARYLEPFAMTWIHMSFACGFGRDFAFVRLRRESAQG
jgi:predicted dinucleotide-binding enzyme